MREEMAVHHPLSATMLQPEVIQWLLYSRQVLGCFLSSCHSISVRLPARSLSLSEKALMAEDAVQEALVAEQAVEVALYLAALIMTAHLLERCQTPAKNTAQISI